jgi:hypothetical protein
MSDTVTISRREYERLIADAEAAAASKTIEEFCKAERISRSTYYQMRAEEWGPVEMAVGESVRISPSAHQKWREEREQAMRTGERRKLGEGAHA